MSDLKEMEFGEFHPPPPPFSPGGLKVRTYIGGRGVGGDPKARLFWSVSASPLQYSRVRPTPNAAAESKILIQTGDTTRSNIGKPVVCAIIVSVHN